MLHHQALPGMKVNSMCDAEDDEGLRKMLRSPTPIRFDWENKWLRGDQYAHMLYNLDSYVNAFGM